MQVKNQEIIEALEGISTLLKWQTDLVRSLLEKLTDGGKSLKGARRESPRPRPPRRKKPRKP